MQIIRQLPPSYDERTAIAIGNFDGLHLGHRAVIKSMARAARANFAVPSVLTFEPHPRQFFEKNAAPFRILPLRDKLSALRNAGARTIFMPRFDAAIASIMAEDFMNRVLRYQLNAAVVVTGENFVFGHKRRGNVAMLRAWGMANGVKVITVKPVMVDGALCSSSAVRAALTQGDMDEAAKLLGRTYRLSGHVVHGDGLGSRIGYPTANLGLAQGVMLPAHGVYVVRTNLNGRIVSGVANVGVRPTVASYAQPSVEVHLFDVRQDIYAKLIQISFVTRLRPEMKFDGVEALVAQIGKDCDMARQVLQTLEKAG